jgi:hypothetical protein
MFTTPKLIANRSGPAVIQRQAVIEQTAYQRSFEDGLEPPPLTMESVRYWSDFNRVYYHPKSIIQLNQYELGSSLMPFEKWTLGEDLFSSLDKEHDILDSDLRPFAEEADHIQGIQIISSVDDAWGGFSARYLERLRDEYGKNTVWVWGLEDEMRNTPKVSYTYFIDCHGIKTNIAPFRTRNYSKCQIQHGLLLKCHLKRPFSFH